MSGEYPELMNLQYLVMLDLNIVLFVTWILMVIFNNVYSVFHNILIYGLITESCRMLFGYCRNTSNDKLIRCQITQAQQILNILFGKRALKNMEPALYALTLPYLNLESSTIATTGASWSNTRNTMMFGVAHPRGHTYQLQPVNHRIIDFL